MIGNPILDVIEKHDAQIKASESLVRLGLAAQRYFVVTMHRAENVDNPKRLRAIVKGVWVQYPGGQRRPRVYQAVRPNRYRQTAVLDASA